MKNVSLLKELEKVPIENNIFGFLLSRGNFRLIERISPHHTKIFTLQYIYCKRWEWAEPNRKIQTVES